MEVMIQQVALFIYFLIIGLAALLACVQLYSKMRIAMRACTCIIACVKFKYQYRPMCFLSVCVPRACECSCSCACLCACACVRA